MGHKYWMTAAKHKSADYALQSLTKLGQVASWEMENEK